MCNVGYGTGTMAPGMQGIGDLVYIAAHNLAWSHLLLFLFKIKTVLLKCMFIKLEPINGKIKYFASFFQNFAWSFSIYNLIKTEYSKWRRLLPRVHRFEHTLEPTGFTR
jgi:hypothetical protein